MALGSTYADLEIRILGQQEEGYPVELILNSEQEFPRGYLGPALLPWVSSASPAEDGARLRLPESVQEGSLRLVL